MKKNAPILIISIVAVVLCVGWTLYTNYTAEDAFITFSFAKRLAGGSGFTFNPSQPIYGTTTPLLTLILAAWLFIAPDPVFFSKLIGLFSSIGGLWFLYFALPYRKAAIIATALLVVSSKLIAEEMMGMETPLLFLFMAASYWGYTKDRPYLSGIMCGLLLWTRIDSIVYVVALFGSFLFFGTLGRLWASTVKFSIGTMVYLPWVIFSWLYFGSAIPYTITAKIVAYGIGSPPLATHFLRIIDYISWPVFLLTIASVFYLGKRNLFLAVFFTANVLLLAHTGATFMERYLYTVTIVSIVMVSIMVAHIQNRAWKVAIIALMLYGSFNQVKSVSYYKYYQEFRHEVLKDIGIWLNENTPEDAVILLEPLGYVGYYSERYILDEVGLVTPRAVDLHDAGIKGNTFYLYLWPDYVLFQCTQVLTDDFEKYYELAERFNNGYSRACYNVWKIK